MSDVILTREQMRAYDAHAIDACKVPGVVLMENAGRGAADIIAQESKGAVTIVCGRGNNGGDGLVVARHLMTRGFEVRVLLAGEPDRVRGDARANLDAFVGLGGAVTSLSASPGDDLKPLHEALETASFGVDALFGTGLDRPLEGRMLEIVAALNEASCPIVALDIPSGLDANTGAVLGDAVCADLTITFGAYKPGLLQGEAANHTGVIELVELGIPDAGILDHVGCDTRFIVDDDVRDALGTRAPDTHKYRAGSVLVVAGSTGKAGAALLSARAALRAGAGIVTVATWPEVADRIEGRIEEVMTARLDRDSLEGSLEAALDRRNAVAIGPGLGLDESARRVSERLLLGFGGPLIADADAISHFAGRPEELRAAAGPRVLTPHSGELARLLGVTSRDIEADRFAAAREAAKRTGQVIVLKGRHTLVASSEGMHVCRLGNAVLATAGAGDVLTGIVGALLCSSASAHDAACAAVHLHALCADRWREGVGADRGLLAGDLAEGLPDAIASLFSDS
ncbi:MAG TPA: NAD(P)H-hydrate dehydratase [Polyangiaceae bacterium]|jgi:NAD(P)H-hydrate epimerase|nr:NAD(P)H-hydrate dehydratase [Polyangiaceae bacterium]